MDTHRIRRLLWQARARNPAQAFSLRALLREQGEACEAALDRAFGQAVPSDEVWHLPRLALEIRIEDLQRTSADELVERVEAAVRAALAAAGRPVVREMRTAEDARTVDAHAASRSVWLPAQATSAAQHHSTAIEARQALAHYMATGMLPWTLAGLALEQARQSLAEAAAQVAERAANDDAALQHLLADMGEPPARIGALLRWLPLLAPALRRRLTRGHRPLLPWNPALVQAWRAWIDDDAVERIEWQALWLAAPSDPGALRDLILQYRTVAGEPSFLPALRKALTEDRLHDPRSAPAAEKADHAPATTPAPTSTAHATATASPATPAAASANEQLLVPLAGLVLLHPWLPRLLDALGVLDAGGKQIDPLQWPRACALLHALACGGAPIAEHQLPLIKLLLGHTPDEALTVALPTPSRQDHEEIDALLDAVRTHWSALRGTGIDGLRLSFLQRRGLLSRTDDGWRLRMQSEAFDLLLGHLPWGIGLVRLPWMPQPLAVEWPTP